MKFRAQQLESNTYVSVGNFYAEKTLCEERGINSVDDQAMKLTPQQHLETSTYVSVADFYAGKSVFMTGVTGFLGKVYLEKLLYSCKDIENIYVLIRHKKGLNFEQRIQELIDKPLFSRLKKERPQDLKKIIPIGGDIDEHDLGMSTDDQEIILDKVSIIFHVAATIKFHEKLSVAVNTNVGGTKRVLNLCRRMKNIKVFVYVSTAFCNTDKKIIEEKIYPPPADLGEVCRFLEQTHQDKKQIKAFLKELPNTYTFTKALAEDYVAKNHGNIPTIIIRPSIVSSSLREPLTGWLDSWAGATGIMTAVMKGANRVVLGDQNNILDLIPVDYVANITIVAAARCNSSNEVTVYNCSTSSCNPVTLKTLFKVVRRSAKTDVENNTYPTLIFTNNKLSLSILTFLLQTTPAYAADLRLRAKRKQPRYMKIQSKVVFGRGLLNYFTSNSWEIKAERAQALHASLSADDKHKFPCNPSDINWDEYIAIYYEGIKRFLLK